MKSAKRLVTVGLRTLGFAIIGGSVYFGISSDESLNSGGWLHIPSLITVAGCLAGYILASFQPSQVWEILKTLISCSPSKLEYQLNDLGKELSDLSQNYYSSGVSSLKSHTQNSAFPEIWRNIFSQLEARLSPKDVRTLVQYEARREIGRVSTLIELLGSLVSLSPTVGMLGTVIGLVKLLGQLQDISKLGPNMAMAMLTTLYGIFFSVGLFSPLNARLQALRDLRHKGYNQALFWLHLIETQKPVEFLGLGSNKTS
jgi:chemotaxis protein MotA